MSDHPGKRERLVLEAIERTAEREIGQLVADLEEARREITKLRGIIEAQHRAIERMGPDRDSSKEE